MHIVVLHVCVLLCINMIVVYFQFTGYDVGNNMIHVGGELITMFPADGGQIRCEKTHFIQGGYFSHTFTTFHINWL